MQFLAKDKMKQLYVIYFTSANYCGYGEHCVVWAENEEKAREIAAPYAEAFYYEDDYNQYVEENDGEDADAWASINTVELLIESDSYEFYQDKEQRESFYPCVNPEDAPNGN